jgi:hypothetical protein
VECLATVTAIKVPEAALPNFAPRLTRVIEWLWPVVAEEPADGLVELEAKVVLPSPAQVPRETHLAQRAGEARKFQAELEALA